MTDKNNENVNIPADDGQQTEDSISLRSGLIKDKVIERKIKPAPVEHTSGGDEIRIPESVPEVKQPEDVHIPRFIKTNATPVVSVSGAEKPENDGRDIDKFSDRLTVKPPEKKSFAGQTAKHNIYPSVHSSSAEKGRMILTAETAAEPEAEQPAPEAKGDTREVSADNADILSVSGDAEEDIADTFPTRPMDPQKGALLREIADTAEDGVRRNPDQLMMEGFDNADKKDDEASERERAQLRAELNKTREKRINSFKFWSKKDGGEQNSTSDEKFSGETESVSLPAFLQKIADRFAGLDTSFTPVPGEEYVDFNDRKEVFTRLLQERKNVIMRLLTIGTIGLILLIIDIAAGASAAANANGFFSVFGGNYTVFVTVNLALLIAAGVFMFRELKNGLFSLLKVHPKADTSLLLLMVCAFIQNICAYFTQLKLEENFRLMAPAAILLCVPYLLAKLFYYDNARQCFKAAAAKSDKSYLRRVSDEELVSGLLRDRENTARNVVYSGRTRFIDRFLERSAESAIAGMPSSRVVLIASALSLVVGIIAAAVKQDPVYGITALTACLAFSFPVSCLAATGLSISAENKKLSVKSSFVQSLSDARDFAAVDNIVINTGDVFSAEITNCLTAKGVSDKQAQFCAAVLTSGFGGPLNAALMEKVSALEDKFPAAENLVYEEKLGLSAWVSNCKVLLGSHALLVNHNVQVPDEKAVTAFLGEDEKPVYLALEGKFAAVFGVKYSCLSEAAVNLRELVKNGANVLLVSYDANLGESYAEELLGMPECSVNVVSAAAAEKLGASMRAVTDSEEAGIVFTDSFESLCRCACAALRLDRAKKISKIVCEAGAFVGFALAAVLALTGAFASISPLLAVVVQSIWIALCVAAPMIFGNAVSMKKTAAKPQSRHREAPAQAEAPAEPANEAVKAAESVPAQKAEETRAEEKENEEDTPGVISQHTFDLLDELAEKPAGRKAKNARREPARAAVEEETAPAEIAEETAENAEEAPEMPDILGKMKNVFGGFVSRFTVAREEADNEAPGEENNGETEKKRPFTATIPVRKHRRSDLEDENDVLRQAEEEKRMRLSFTPPEMPAAPHYDLTEKEPEDDKSRFVPPAQTQTSYYNDSMFSRFEDDNIFAALHEDENK